MEAEALVKAGRLEEALEDLQAGIRKDAANAKLRVFLFQVLSVMGRWDRALVQLNVAAELDAANLGGHYTRRTTYSPEEYYGLVDPANLEPYIEEYLENLREYDNE